MTKWQNHIKDTFKEGRKHDKKYSFKQALKDASDSYDKKHVGGSATTSTPLASVPAAPAAPAVAPAAVAPAAPAPATLLNNIKDVINNMKLPTTSTPVVKTGGSINPPNAAGYKGGKKTKRVKKGSKMSKKLKNLKKSRKFRKSRK